MITFEHVTKVFPGGVTAVRDLCLEVSEGSCMVLLGTSGSGKTTTLRMVNRLIEPSSGRITIDGRDIRSRDVVTLRRDIGYAIQHIGLFPHMTVAENIAIVPGLRGWRAADIADRTRTLLDMVGLDPPHYSTRFPAELSGGQQQRVGVARALAGDPRVILMDEPFGALDPLTRDQLQTEFRTLQKRLGKTVLFVTHDIVEACKLGDLIALFHEGRLLQCATPADLVARPAGDLAAGFLRQHQVHLTLLTRTVADLPHGVLLPVDPTHARSPGSDCIRADDSLLTALETLLATKHESLPVYAGDSVRGHLQRDALLRAAFAPAHQENR